MDFKDIDSNDVSVMRYNDKSVYLNNTPKTNLSNSKITLINLQTAIIT